MTKEQIQNFTFRISNANRTDMMAILYDMGIEYLTGALVALKESKFKDFSDEIYRFRGVNRELMDSVNNETQIGRNFLSIYVFMGKMVTEALINREGEPLERVIGMLTKMSETYRELGKKDPTGPVMEHAETVYSGFTYNRNRVTDNVSNADVNRGFLA